MITKEQKTRLGIFLATSLVLFIAILGLLIIPQLKAKGWIYFINFRGTSVNGLFVGSPVKYQGVEVGAVRHIRVNPEDLNSIRVDMEIQKEFSVKKDMAATMTYTGITGQKFIELSGGKNESENLDPGNEIAPAKGFSEKAEDIVSNIDTAVRRINDLLAADNRKRISMFLENTEKSSAIISQVLKNKEQNLSNAITNIEKASLDFGAVTGNLSKISADLSRLTEKLESSAGTALDGLSKRFSDAEMGKVLKNLEAFIETASSSLKKVENVLLTQQEDLRHNVESLGTAVENLSKFSRQLMEDPTLFLHSRREKKK
jgi:phospholipid/cholesterol/gamma-HCH transport system substrate-binding protein